VAKVGKLLGLISPILAIGAMALMLFALSSSYESASCTPGYGHQDAECNYDSGTISAFQVALEESDYTVFYWFGFVVVVCLIAAAGAHARRAAPVWACAIVLWVLAGLGMLSVIGLFVFPLALVLSVAAMLLTAARYESRRA
jgi:hypothetical protein